MKLLCWSAYESNKLTVVGVIGLQLSMDIVVTHCKEDTLIDLCYTTSAVDNQYMNKVTLELLISFKSKLWIRI